MAFIFLFLYYSTKSCTRAIEFISTNQAQRTIANAAFLITVLITPSILPIKYKGMKSSVAGSKTVNVSITLALINNIVSTNSQ